MWNLTQPIPNAEAYLRRIKITNASSCGVSFFLHLRAIVKEKVIPPGRTECKREQSFTWELVLKHTTCSPAEQPAGGEPVQTNQAVSGVHLIWRPRRGVRLSNHRDVAGLRHGTSTSASHGVLNGFCQHSQGASYMRPLTALHHSFQFMLSAPGHSSNRPTVTNNFNAEVSLYGK